MLRRSRLAVAGVLLCALAACGHDPAPPPGRSRASDPLVLRDVIAATFMVPGEEVLRGMRVRQFLRNLGIVECGGEAGALDDTSGRYNQSRYADLDLIRERGFTEIEAGQAEDRRLAKVRTDCKDLVPDLPGYAEWEVLQVQWEDIVTTAEQDESLVPLKTAMGVCLTQRTGLDIDGSDPINGLLRGVNRESSDAITPARLTMFAQAFADCGAAYFARLTELLLESRPASVERHREVIERLAVQISTSGYVP